MAEANDQYERFRHAAVIVRGGSVQSVGLNKLHTDPRLVDCEDRIMRRKISIHAEADAIRRCGHSRGATIYVARIGRNGEVAMSKPCDHCQELLERHGIKKVVYTIGPNEWGAFP